MRFKIEVVKMYRDHSWNSIVVNSVIEGGNESDDAYSVRGVEACEKAVASHIRELSALGT